MRELGYIIKTSWRNMQRRKSQVILNVISLSIALTSSLLIFGYNFYELSYDSFHKRKDQLYRIQNNVISSETKEILTKRAVTFYGIEGLIEQEIPEIKKSTHVVSENGTIQFDQIKINCDKALYTNAKFFEMFSFPLQKGVLADLDQSGTVFISSTLSNKLFRDDNPIGKRITFFAEQVGRKLELEIKGVFQDFPSNTYFKSDLIISKNEFININTPTITFNPNLSLQQVAWRWINFYTFIELEQNVSEKDVQEKINDFFTKYRGELDKQNGRQQVPIIEKMSEIHLNSGVDSELTPPNSKTTIQIFYVIGILILLITWINYVNMTTASAVNRAREVGIRKVLGAFKKQIFFQLLTESIIVNLIALLLSCTLLIFIIPIYENFLGKDIFSIFEATLIQWSLVLLIIIAGSILSGIYPSIVISAFRPENVLKGSFKYSPKGKKLQRSLMIFQFLIVCILISMSITVYKQIDYMLNKEKGFTEAGKIILKMPSTPFRSDTYDNKVRSMRDQLTSLRNVKSVAGSQIVPGQFNGWTESASIMDQDDLETVSISRFSISSEFINTYDIEIVEGRDFDEKLSSDYLSKALINETGLKSFGFSDPAEIIGKNLRLFGDQVKEIVGVVKDFHQEGLHTQITPTLLHLDSIHSSAYLTVEVENLENGIDQVRGIFLESFPSNVLDYQILDDSLKSLYEIDKKFQKIFTIFTILSILLAVSGLHSLSTFFTNNRRKEISIRKVLGADTRRLISLLLTEYWRLVIISSLVSLPISYYAINRWLEGYSFHIEIQFTLIFIPVLLIGLLVILSVLQRTINLASSNPVNNLRSE